VVRQVIGRGALLVFMVMAVALNACANTPTDTPGQGQDAAAVSSDGYQKIDAAGLAAMLQHKDFQLVNVHIPYEGEIGGTDKFLAYDKVAENLAQLPPEKNARIVLYCRSGRMSEIAAKELVGLGYTDVWELQGGMVDWERAGNELVHRPGQK
jgi:rhodanese-related sulfurtransferase